MKYLKAAIAIRTLDSLGLVTREMKDIRNEFFLVKHGDEKIYSGKVNYSEKASLVFLYTEVFDHKYMITFLETNDGKDQGDLTLCIVSCDLEETDPELSKLILGTKNKEFRDVSFLEAAKFLNTFETVRNHMPYWVPNTPQKEQIEYLFSFINAINIG